MREEKRTETRFLFENQCSCHDSSFPWDSNDNLGKMFIRFLSLPVSILKKKQNQLTLSTRKRDSDLIFFSSSSSSSCWRMKSDRNDEIRFDHLRDEFINAEDQRKTDRENVLKNPTDIFLDKEKERTSLLILIKSLYTCFVEPSVVICSCENVDGHRRRKWRNTFW